MGVFTLTLFVVFFIFSLTSAFAEMKVKPGDNVTLQCQSPGGETITLLEWIRPDLKTDGYVFFYRNNQPYEDYQHPSFHGRVQLRDPEMKNGDVSVILKNVTINDTGTYQCYVSVNGKGHELMNSINLKVEDSGDKDGGGKDGMKKEQNIGLTVGLPVAAVLVVVVVVVVVVIHKQCRQSPAHYRTANPTTVHP